MVKSSIAIVKAERKERGKIMKKRSQWIAVLLSAAILCNGCTMLAVQKEEPKKEVQKTEESKKEKNESRVDKTSGWPWIDSDLDGAITKKTKVDLKDDFAAAVNKKWLVENKLQEGEISYSIFDEVKSSTDERIKKLITGKKHADNKEVKNMRECYKLWMDWKSRNKLGISPAMPVVEKLKKIQNIDDLNQFLTLPSDERGGLGILVYDVQGAFQNSSKKILWISPRNLSLGDSAEYDEMSETGKRTKKALEKLNRKLLKKAGFHKKEVEQIIKHAFQFENEIAPSILTSVEQKSPDGLNMQNHPITKEELEKMQGQIPATQMLLQSGFEERDIQNMNLMMPDWLEGLKKLYTEENVAMIRDYLLVQYLGEKATYLDKECYKWVMDESNEIDGTTGYNKDKDNACAAVQDLMGEQVAKAYSEVYVTKEDKDILTELTNDIIEEYRDMLQEEEFLSDKTKSCAVEKLDNIKIHILYPETWPDYANIEIKSKSDGGTYWDAVEEARKSEEKHMVESIRGEIDNKDWGDGVLTTDVNCYNNVMENSINILAGWCQGENYNKKMTKEELYGRIGYAIGHEISHSFDSKGAQFDKNGNLANWWEEKDLAEFKTRNDKMANYYSAMYPWEGANLEGSILTGEAGADMTSFKCMLRMAEKIPSFNYDKFFRAYASGYRSLMTLEAQENHLGNEHPMGYLRVNTVLQQFDKFNEVYDIKEGDGMYLAPEDRVIIW